MDDEFVAFFKEHRLSRRHQHRRPPGDARRVSRRPGRGADVGAGPEGAGRASSGMAWISTPSRTLHPANADHPLELYHFFRDELGARYIQFIPISSGCRLRRSTCAHPARLSPGLAQRRPGCGRRPLYRQAGEPGHRPVGDGGPIREVPCRHLRGVGSRDVGYGLRPDVRPRSGELARPAARVCASFSPTCGTALAMEHNGDMYSCDHFVEAGHLLGNRTQTHMVEMVASQATACIWPGQAG